MRVAGFGLQADLDLDLAQIRPRQAAPRHFGAQPFDVDFADVEVDVDRIELNDRRKLGRSRAAADVLANRHLMRRNDPVERRFDMGVVDVELGELRACLGLREVRLRGVARRQQLVVLLLARALGGDERRDAVEVSLRLIERSLCACHGRLSLRKLDVVGARLDGEEERAGFDESAVLVADAVDKSRHPGDKVVEIDRRGRPRQVEVAGDRPLGGRRNRHLGRRRRDIAILAAAGSENQRRGGECSN